MHCFTDEAAEGSSNFEHWDEYTRGNRNGRGNNGEEELKTKRIVIELDPWKLKARAITHRKQQINNQVGKNVGVNRSPIGHDGGLLHGEFILAPGEIRKQLMDLLVGAQLARYELTEAMRE